MKKVLDIILTQIWRWRSITVLTDTWAPLHTALQQIQPTITTKGAPLLESLTLMRCNDFISYSSTFEPRELKGPAFLTLPDSDNTRPLLPRLQNLTLRGVHVDWSGLASILARNANPRLSTLEISSHSLDVRPTVPEFHHILAACPTLTKLVINGSGPFIPEDDENATAGLDRVSLSSLRELSIGYRSAYESQVIFELFDAPNVRTLTLEDATHPSEPEAVNADGLLTYIATGEFPAEIDYDYIVVCTPSEGLHSQLTVDKEDSIHQRSSSTMESSRPRSTSHAAFPLLESKNVKSCPRPLHALFAALPQLHHLELDGMSMQDVRALLPHRELNRLDAYTYVCPCPRLQYLCIKDFDDLQVQDFAFLLGGLAVQRLKQGGCGLKEVNVYVGGVVRDEQEMTVEHVICLSQVGTTIKIITEIPREEEEDDEDDGGMECSYDPFKRGGAFNDPVFDAQYGGALYAGRV
jgi:hypothetical protein